MIVEIALLLAALAVVGFLHELRERKHDLLIEQRRKAIDKQGKVVTRQAQVVFGEALALREDAARLRAECQVVLTDTRQLQQNIDAFLRDPNIRKHLS